MQEPAAASYADGDWQAAFDAVGNGIMILDANLAHEERIEVPVAEDVLARLSQIPDFVRAYAPDGIAVADFLSFGLTQRTLSQFIEAGWGPLESYPA